MRIATLTIENLRIIEALGLSANNRVNVVSGDNGAGKTSILEAIYLSGRGRSFRHVEARPLVRAGAKEAQVVSKLFDPRSGRVAVLGIARGPADLRCRLDGEELRRRSALAEALPVQWIGSQPQALLESGPDSRRRFIDMAVFHVEHNYVTVLGEYQRLLKQRNAALRSTAADRLVSLWDEPLAAAADTMDRARRDVLTQIFEAVARILTSWRMNLAVSYRYRGGWGKERTLLDELAARLAADRLKGFTGKGPHRAELEILSADAPSQKVLSRGQQKMLVIAMHLATIETIARRHADRMPILLIDDLAAELDYENRRHAMNAIMAIDCQAFVTRLTDDSLPEVAEQSMFHVEHGELK